MYLKKIQLDHWGCHDDLQIDFHEGLNVCVGPNGAGKSTLYHAIVAALTVKHDATSQRVAAFKSWGKDGFGPTATLEIVRDEVVWNLTKSYLFEPRCLLERNGGGQAPYKAKGKVAEQELDGWLEGDGAAGRLILTLWSNQNDPIQIFQPLQGAKTPSPGAWVDQILARVGRPEAAGPFASVKKGVAERYMARITPTKMDVKKTSDLDLAGQECAKAGQRVGELQAKGRELADKAQAYKVRSARHAEDCTAREGLRRRREELEALEVEYRAKAETWKEAEGHAARLRERHESMEADNAQLAGAERAKAEFEARLADLRPAVEQAGRVLDAAGGAFRDAERRHQSARPLLDDLASCFERRNLLEAAIRKVRERRADEGEARVRHDEAARELRQAAERLQAAREESTHAGQTLAAARRRGHRRGFLAAEEAYRQAEAEHRRVSEWALVAERAGLRELLGKVRAWSAALAVLDPSGDGGPVPSTTEWQSLQDENQKLTRLEQGLDADSLTFRLVARVPLQARLSGDGLDPEIRDLSAGGAFEGRGVTSFSIEIEGVGRIEVGRSAGEPSARMEALRHGRESLSARLVGLGASDVAELDVRRRRDDERLGLRERICSHLGSRTIAELEARHVELDVELESFDAGSDVPVSPPPKGPRTQALRRRLDSARETLAVARAALESDGVESPLDEADPTTDLTEAGRQAELALDAMEEAEGRLKAAELAGASARGDLGN
ncbi:MAG: AAA family ATPase, partial [Singulisphaera sp.]